MSGWNALILAGSRGNLDWVAVAAGVSDKALAEVGGLTMLERVVRALREAGAGRIGVATGSEPVIALAISLGCEIVPARSGPSESAAAGLAQMGAPMLLTTADHALLRAEWVTDFLERIPAGVDICALLATQERIVAAVPDARRTWLRFADARRSGCNLFYLATPEAGAALQFWRAVEADRKQPWKIARRLGLGLLLRYAVGRLTLADAFAHLGRLAGVRAAAVDTPFGLAAVDVDKPDDLVLARSLVG
ncbi:MAG: nucleotidyltransferase family protein [Sphingobium sp.]